MTPNAELRGRRVATVPLERRVSRLEDEMTKRLRAPKAKPGELKMQWGKLPGDCPDMCFAWGDGCSKRDGNFLHYVLASPRPRTDRDEHGLPQWDKSVIEQLDERGYDLTTLRFSIMKKTANVE